MRWCIRRGMRTRSCGGGFSAYYNSLSPALKQSILERTEHSV